MKTAHDLVIAAKARVMEISLDEAAAAILAADVLVDVREADEYTLGHVPGSVHVSRGTLEFKFSANAALQARDLNIVLYCKTGGRAALAAVALQDMGYLNVKSIAGGFDGWAASGKPVAKPEPVPFD